MRPETVSYVLFALFLWIVERHRRQGGRLIFALPALQVLWVNSHTLFALGPIVATIHALVELAGRLRASSRGVRRRAGIRNAVAVAVLCFVACPVNPWGLAGALFPLRLLEEIRGTLFKAGIQEFAGPFSVRGGYDAIPAYVALIALCGLSVAVSLRRLDPFRTAVCAATLWLSTLAIRNLPLFALAAVPFVAANLAESRLLARLARTRSARVLRAALAGAVIFAAIGGSWAMATNRFQVRQQDTNRFGLGWAPHRYPVRAADFLQAHGVPQPVFATMHEASYLLTRGIRPFIDPRLEVYGEPHFARYLRALQDDAAWRELVAVFGIKAAVVNLAETSFVERALASGAWHLAHWDECAAVLVRQDVLPDLVPAVAPLRSEADWQRAIAAVRMGLSAPHAWDRLGPFGSADSPTPYHVVANFLLAVGLPEEAEPFLRDALAAYPGAARARLTYASLLDARGADEEAGLQYERAYRNAPDDPDVASRAGLHSLEVGDADEAARRLERNLRRHPGHAPSWAIRGEVYLAGGDAAAAESCLAVAARLDPGNPTYAARRAAARAARNRRNPRPGKGLSESPAGCRHLLAPQLPPPADRNPLRVPSPPHRRVRRPGGSPRVKSDHRSGTLTTPFSRSDGSTTAEAVIMRVWYHPSRALTVSSLLLASLLVPAELHAAEFRGVQSGTAVCPQSGTVRVAIQPVDPTKAFLLFGCRSDDNEPTGSMVRGRISSADSVEFVRVAEPADTSVITVQWSVVEYSSGVRVQRGEVAQSAATVDVPLAIPVTAVDQAFVTWSKTPGAAQGSYASPMMVLAELTSPGNLQIRSASSRPDNIISWQVVEFTNGADIDVQKGSITTMGATGTSVTATLGSAVDPSRTFVLVGYLSPGGGVDIGSRMLRAVLTNPTTITIDRSTSGVAPGDDISEIHWQAVQLNDGSRVQGGSESFAAGVGLRTIAVTPVDVSRSVAFASVQPVAGQNLGRSPFIADDNLGAGSFTMSLASPSQLEVRRNFTVAASDVGWFLVQFGSVADLAVTKTVSDPTPNEGDPISYTVTLANAGPDGATGVQVTDLLPAGVTFQSFSATQGTYTSGTGLWDVGAVASAGSAVLTLNVTVDAGTGGTTIENEATITASDQADGNPANDTASATITVQAADLGLTKTVSDPTPNEGDPISYTVTITNGGPDGATGVQVTDLLPAGVTFQSFSATQGTYASGTGLWDVGAVASAGSAVLTLNVTVDAGTGGTSIENEATITASDQADPNPANDSASATITVQAADLGLTKTVSDPTPDEGDPISYTVTLTNAGPDGATGVQVIDLLPAGVTFQSFSATQGTYASGTGLWDVGAVASADSAVLTMNVTVDAGTGGTSIENEATITASDQADPNPANDSASVVLWVQGANPDEFQVTSGAASEQRPAWSPDASSLVFDSDVTGNPDLWVIPSAGGTAVQLTTAPLLDRHPDWSPDATTIVYSSRDGSAPNPDLWLIPSGGGTPTLLFADPVANEEFPVWSPNGSQIAFSSAGDIWVIASGGGTPTRITTDPANDLHPSWSPDGTMLAFVSDRGGNNDLWVIPSSGGTATRVTTNPANDSAPDWSPDGTRLAFQSVRSGNTEIWVIPVTGGMERQITADPGIDVQPDWSPSGDRIVFARDGDLWIYTFPVDLVVTKTVDDPNPVPGDTVTYTVTVRNDGPKSASGVEVTDLLPSGVTLQTATPSQGTYTAGTGVWAVGALPFGGSGTLTLVCTVDLGTGGATIGNTASVTASDQPDRAPGNDSASASITVRRVLALSAASDQSFFVGDPPHPIAALRITDDDVSPSITAADDLRIRIPAALAMAWDVADVTATIGGPAAAKVSPTVTYEDGAQTLVLDVTTDFAAGDEILVSDLVFTSFTAVSSGSLELEVGNDGLVSAVDDKTITIADPVDAPAVPFVPAEFALSAGRPNPFRDATTISFDMPVPGNAHLSLYDVAGRLVRTLVAGPLPAGRHVATWDGGNDDGGRVSVGVYFVRFEAGSFAQTRKIVRLR